MLVAVLLGGVFYVVTMCAQTWGFGTDDAGVRAFASSTTPLSDLATSYLGRSFAEVLDVAAVLSAGGAALGGVVVGSRMLLTFGRSGVLPWLDEVRAGLPRRSLALELLVTLLLLTGFRVAGAPVGHAFFYLATIGVLNLLFMYAVTNAAAVRHLIRTGRRKAVLLPVGGVFVAVYVLYRNVWPVPQAPYNLFPYIVG